jgi:hypothetical protein
MSVQRTLTILPQTFAVCRLDPHAAVPGWVTEGEFTSMTRTPDELSIVCVEQAVPEGIRCERDWRCLRVAGPMPFSLIGVVAGLTAPLAEAQISVFVVSSFDTDYLLVKQKDWPNALDVLRRAGYAIQQPA